MVHYFIIRPYGRIFGKGGENLRRFFLFVTAFILIFALTAQVSAAPAASKISYFATVTSDGRCQVNMTVTMRVDQETQDLRFPIPAQAGGISLAGSWVFTSREADVRYVSLKRVIGKSTGDITFNLSYTLPDVIHTNELGLLELQLPMLCGLVYPVEQFEFSVSLPAPFDTLPGFVSGYHQAGIEEFLTYQIDGATITGSAMSALKDHETLSMKLSVTETLFPQGLADTQDWSAGAIAMAICGLVALLYWLLTLRFLPLRRIRCTEPPEGFTAGDLGGILHLQGADLTMTVLTWARLGYVMLETDRSGKVLIRKRMHMGNERKDAEQRLFRALFSRRDTVDTQGRLYAQLLTESAKKPQGLSELVHRRSGNPKVFRILASGIGLFGGVCIAIALGNGALLQGLLILALGIGGGISGYLIQAWGRCLTIHDPWRMTLCIIMAAGWLVLSLLADMFQLGLGMVAGLLLAGWLLAWGGRRTEQGKILAAQVSGLSRYLSTVNAEQLRQLSAQVPDYFFTLAPCAIALGQGASFARRFGKQRLEECPYLIGVRAGSGTASEWMQQLQRCVRQMNSRAEKRFFEQLAQFIGGLIRMIRNK